jgi:phosphoadenosine phosphosulfate reductase
MDNVQNGLIEDIQQLNSDFEARYPQDILRWAAETYGDRLAVVTSFQPTGIVTLHMLSELAPQTPVLTLDTGLLFPETYALMDALEQRLTLRLIRIRPVQTVTEQASKYGPNLWEREPDECCNLRKTLPLAEALADYDAWITGLRRDQSAGRSNVPVIGLDKKHSKVKLSPFVLHDQGYPSIGCYPCTRAVDPNSHDKRAGRWANHAKTECGIHVNTLNTQEKLN